jgi:hypothetical protein
VHNIEYSGVHGHKALHAPSRQSHFLTMQRFALTMRTCLPQSFAKRGVETRDLKENKAMWQSAFSGLHKAEYDRYHAIFPERFIGDVQVAKVRFCVSESLQHPPITLHSPLMHGQNRRVHHDE